MIFISAGHHNADPGAVSNGVKEADLTKELRDLICKELATAKASFISDKDFETLSQYISRIKPGSGSVVCEVHFNAGSPNATGVETIVRANAAKESIALAKAINNAVVNASGLYNRGVKDETQSHRGRLAILHTAAGISVLPELCFITNKNDLVLYNKAKKEIAKGIAKALIEADRLFA